MSIDHDDPRLTAYALGELDESGRAEVEALLDQSPEARAVVAEICNAARLLTENLRAEQGPGLAAEQLRTIESELNPTPAAPRPSRIRWYALAATFIVGAGALTLTLRQQLTPQSAELPSGAYMSDGSVAYKATEAPPASPALPPIVASSREELRQFGRERNEALGPAVASAPVPDGRFDRVNRFALEASPAPGPVGGMMGGMPGEPGQRRAGKQGIPGMMGVMPGQPAQQRAGTQGMPGMMGGGMMGGGMMGMGGGIPSAGRTVVAVERGNLEKRSQLAEPLSDLARDSRPLDRATPASDLGVRLELESVVAPLAQAEKPFNTEAYDRIKDNPFVRTDKENVSTFSIDVDTASYANVRRFLMQNALPPRDAVRIEELVNYFRYDDPAPREGNAFRVTTEIAGCPWNADNRLLRIAIKGREIDLENRPPGNLVFLVDVSGSMHAADKLPLLKTGLALLVEKLGENDRVAIVTYASGTRVVLPPTPCDRKREILSAIDQLQAAGSTNGGAGIQLAYDAAVASFIKGGINRVILATDGDFNVGITDAGSLQRLIEEKARTGVFLSVLGFGQGNLQDARMEQLADKGNGNYSYIDSIDEARKVLVDEMGGTLVAIAKDVKIQVDFNPGRVAAYRLVGYENRLLENRDFADDTKDAGEIGAGHSVVAFYELVPPGKAGEIAAAEGSKYTRKVEVEPSDETLTVKLRYKAPEGETSSLIERPIQDDGRDFASASPDFKFSAAVASFAMLLRDSAYKGSLTFGGVIELASGSVGADPMGHRREFLELVRRAQALPGR